MTSSPKDPCHLIVCALSSASQLQADENIFLLRRRHLIDFRIAHIEKPWVVFGDMCKICEAGVHRRFSFHVGWPLLTSGEKPIGIKSTASPVSGSIDSATTSTSAEKPCVSSGVDALTSAVGNP